MFRRIAILGAIAFGILSSSLFNTGCGLDVILPGTDTGPTATSGLPPPQDYPGDQDDDDEEEDEDDEEDE